VNSTLSLGAQHQFKLLPTLQRLVVEKPEVPLSRVSWIVGGLFVLEAQRTDGGYLRDVFAGLCLVEVPVVAGQHDNASGRICLEIFRIELFTQADVKDARNDSVNAVLRVPCGMSFTPEGSLTLIV